MEIMRLIRLCRIMAKAKRTIVNRFLAIEVMVDSEGDEDEEIEDGDGMERGAYERITYAF